MSIQVEPPKRRTATEPRSSLNSRRGTTGGSNLRQSSRNSKRAEHRGRHTSNRGDGFGRFTGVTLLSLFPGLGLVAAGRRRVGAIITFATLLLLAMALVIALSGDALGHLMNVGTDPTKLLLLSLVLILCAGGWCMTVVAASWDSRPQLPTTIQRFTGSGLVCLVCLLVAAPGMYGAKYAIITRKTVLALGEGSAARVKDAARPSAKSSDPWAKQPRVNLLLLGSDAGANRSGIRTDSMIVASIDTKTGKTTLIGLPRSLQKVPFPEDNPLSKEYPNGFDCGSECLLNAVWRQADTDKAYLFKGQKNPGLITTRGVISEITGLRIDAYTIINLSGFKSLVNAMGGVTVDVKERLPIGSETPPVAWVEAGKRKLDGEEALWFSRSRKSTDDYDRMRRQRCLVGNLVNDVKPAQLIAKYPELAEVVQENIQTDIPPNEFQAWSVLVQRMKKGGIQSLPLTNKVVNTVNPDFDEIREYIAAGIAPPEKPVPNTVATPEVSAKTAESRTTRAEESTTEKSSPAADATKPQDNADVC